MSKSEAKNLQNARALRILFFSTNPKVLKPSIEYLKHNNYVSAVLDKLKDPLGAIDTMKADVVLLSWGFGAEEVREIYEGLMAERPELLVMIFSESDNTREVASLTRSGIQHTIFPPISGKGIEKRVAQFLNKRRRAKGRPRNLIRRADLSEQNLQNLGKVEVVLPKEIPDDSQIVWKQVVMAGATKGPTGIAAPKIWRSESRDSSQHLEKTYFVESEQVPTYNPEEKSWTGLEEGSIVAMSAEPTGSGLAPAVIHMAMNFEDYHIRFNKLATSDESGHSDAAQSAPDSDQENVPTVPFTEYRKPGVEKPSAFEQIVRNSASGVFSPPDHATRKIMKLENVGAMLIKNAKYNGYLLIANADNAFDAELAENFAKPFVEAMDQSDAKSSSLMRVMHVKLDSIPFNSWGDRLEFLALFSHLGQDVALIYVPSLNLPEEIGYESKLLHVALEDNLFPNSVLNFDLYLHLPANSKYVHYLKKGTVLTQAVLDKFHQYKVNQLAIPKGDLELFIAYLIRGVLRKP